MTTYAHVIDALADGTRRAVLERLRAGPLSVGDVARGLPVTRPAVSQHLRVLKDAGLVTDRRSGNRRVYGLALGGLAELRRYLEAFWDVALDDFKTAAEAPHDRRDR